MFLFGDCNGCNTEIHEKHYLELHQLIHDIETGDLVFSNALGSKAFWIQFGTRSRFTHIAMAIRLGELSFETEQDNTNFYEHNGVKKDRRDTFCVDRTISDVYNEFMDSLKTKRRRYPKICPRDCLNTVCLWESTNYTDNYDIWKGNGTSGCHLVLLFDKCNNQGYKYFGIRKLFALYHPSPVLTELPQETTIIHQSSHQMNTNKKQELLLLQQQQETRTRRQIPLEYLKRIWEFILMTYSKPYDGSFKSIMMSVHKSFSNPSLVYKNYCRNTHSPSINHSTISNDNQVNHTTVNSHKTAETTITLHNSHFQRNSSLDLLRDVYSKKEHFFCSALIAATLRFCGILASGQSNEKVNDNDWSPDDFTDDDMLELIRSFEYSNMKYFNGINIVLLLGVSDITPATTTIATTTATTATTTTTTITNITTMPQPRIGTQKRKSTPEPPEPNARSAPKKRKKKKVLPTKFVPFLSSNCPSLSILEQMES